MDEKKVRIWIEFVLHFEFTVFSSILFFFERRNWIVEWWWFGLEYHASTKEASQSAVLIQNNGRSWNAMLNEARKNKRASYEFHLHGEKRLHFNLSA